MKTGLAISIQLASCSLLAQIPGDTLSMYFDDASDSLHLDSIYPAGCWQVGTPNKPVFTSAFSPGRALVTDTILPHADSTTCYAEFSLIATGSIWDHGRYLEFMHWVDTDSLDSYGDIQGYDHDLGQWHSLTGSPEHYFTVYPPYLTDFQTQTDSMVLFTGRSNGWRSVSMSFGCLKFLPAPDTVQLRFVFRSGNNPSGRDGWMIDNIRVTANTCVGGIAEGGMTAMKLYPNPASTSVEIHLDGTINGKRSVDVATMDGRIVATNMDLLSSESTIDVSGFGAGFYLVRVIGPSVRAIAPLVVQR